MNNNQKATKRALLTSVMALVMCVVMLVGTTFAWFTDTASTAVNKIQAGNLDVKLSYLTKDKEWKEVTETTKLFDDEALWEPGHTEVAYLMVENVGSLALKYQLSVNVANEVTSTSVLGNTLKLSDYIKMGVVDGQSTAFADRDAARAAVQAAGNIATYTKNGNIDAGDNAQYVAVVVYMPETVGNEANYAVGETVPSIELGVKLFATQDTVEFDSFDDQYDKDAPIVYPAGVTTDSFPASVSYPTYNGRTETAEAVAAYVDSAGNAKYAADLANAIKDGATTIYLKKGADVKTAIWGTNRTPDLTSDLTIYANGADFQYGEIALNSTTTAAKNITVKVYDAKNLYIWGYSPAGDKALTVLMENCHNVGASATEDKGRMFYISNNSTRGNGTINVTLRNCSVEKSDSPVYMNADGSMTLDNCTFVNCAVPVNNNYKSNETRTDVVKNCTFIRCGCTVEMNSGISGYAAPIRFVKSGSGTLNVTLENNTFTDTIGTNGDILLGDYRTGKTSNSFTAEIVTDHPVMVKSSAGAASNCGSGTINVANH